MYFVSFIIFRVFFNILMSFQQFQFHQFFIKISNDIFRYILKIQISIYS